MNKSNNIIPKRNPDLILDLNAIRLKQQGRVLYVFSLTASEIKEMIDSGRLDVDRWTPTHEEGYQRVPVDYRCRQFGKFVLQGGISPMSILISLRRPGALQVSGLNGLENLVRLKITEGAGKLFIPDGQHRAYGLQWLADHYPGEKDDFEIPVVLFTADGGDPLYEEAGQFFIINNNTKKTRTDLAQRYVLRGSEKSGALTADLMIPPGPYKEILPYAIKISDLVNREGPLAGKILPPNTKLTSSSVTQGSFVDSLRPLITKAGKARWKVKKVVDIINAFWSAVKERCPLSFSHWHGDSCPLGNPEHFNGVLLTTSGIFALNDLLARSMLIGEVLASPDSPETYRSLLSKPETDQFFSDGPEGYWGVPAAGGASEKGTGRKAFKIIADSIWKAVTGD